MKMHHKTQWTFFQGVLGKTTAGTTLTIFYLTNLQRKQQFSAYFNLDNISTSARQKELLNVFLPKKSFTRHFCLALFIIFLLCIPQANLCVSAPWIFLSPFALSLPSSLNLPERERTAIINISWWWVGPRWKDNGGSWKAGGVLELSL